MDAEEIDTAAAAAELNILGGLASVTGLQSPAPTRPAGATANDASKDEASSTPSAPRHRVGQLMIHRKGRCQLLHLR